jgi:hypothetical protein
VSDFARGAVVLQPSKIAPAGDGVDVLERGSKQLRLSVPVSFAIFRKRRNVSSVT